MRWTNSPRTPNVFQMRSSWWSILRLIRSLPGPAPANPRYDPGRAHHTPAGFRNNYPHRAPTPEEMEAGRAQANGRSRGAPLRVDLSPVPPDLAFLRANRSQPAVTW